MVNYTDAQQLLARCRQFEGASLGQVAYELGIFIPLNPLKRKGWIGQALELLLGTTAGNQSLPDFPELGIELKTLPLNHLGKPAESTFVTSIPLLTIQQQTWETSQCFAKLKKVLWIPVEGENSIPFAQRRLGRAVLWSPTVEEEQILKQDWQELTQMISMGQLESLDAKLGHYLQVRPKAAHGKSLCYGYDEVGNKILTLPRGFYLRPQLTQRVLTQAFARVNSP